MAAPPLGSLGSSVVPIVVVLTGTYNASVADVLKFPAPFDCTLLYATACAQAKGGTQGTSTVTINNNGQAVSNAMDLGTPAAKAVVESALVPAQMFVAKDSMITADLVVTGGTTPSLNHITLTLWLQRRG